MTSENQALSSIPSFCGISGPDGFIDPDPDIAGIGVLVSFITIGSLAMILTLVEICRNDLKTFKFSHLFWPEVPFLTKDGRQPTLEDARQYLRSLQNDDSESKLTESDVPIAGSSSVLGSTLFGIADTQFATGIAVSVAAFTKEDITGYHYFIADEMAWLAFLSSTAAFLTARRVIDTSNSVKKGLRIFLMWCLFCLCVGFEARRNDDIGFAEQMYSVSPFWDLSSSDVQISILLLLQTSIALIIDTISLYPEACQLIYYYGESFLFNMSPPLGSLASHTFRGCTTCQLEWSRVFRAAHRLVHASALAATLIFWCPFWVLNLICYWTFFFPLTAHLFNIFFFIWGARASFVWRSMGARCMKPEEHGDESQYGFGQVVALTLLISPIVANADAWYDAYKRWRKHRRSNRAPTLDPTSSAAQIRPDATSH